MGRAPIPIMSYIFGTSPNVIQPKDCNYSEIKAEFYDWAPFGCPCCPGSWCKCCTPDEVRQRMYLYAGNKQIQMNFGRSLCPFVACSEHCIFDFIQVFPYDKQPFRQGMCCCCPPFTCCGPPVIFVKDSK